MCTTCHNQHLMNVVKVTKAWRKQTQALGLPSGTYATMFFIRAPYNPASGTAGSNQTAQFCRQCHGAEANEMNGGTSVTTVSRSFACKGEGVPFPPLLFPPRRSNVIHKFSPWAFLLLAAALSHAQVASHAPTVFRQAPARESLRHRAIAQQLQKAGCPRERFRPHRS